MVDIVFDFPQLSSAMPLSGVGDKVLFVSLNSTSLL